jgi:hypothetical protein
MHWLDKAFHNKGIATKKFTKKTSMWDMNRVNVL